MVQCGPRLAYVGLLGCRHRLDYGCKTFYVYLFTVRSLLFNFFIFYNVFYL